MEPPINPRTGQRIYNPPAQEAQPQARQEENEGVYRGRSASPTPEAERSTPPPAPEQSQSGNSSLSSKSIELSSLTPNRRACGPYKGYLEARHNTPESSIEETPSIGPLRGRYARPDCGIDSPQELAGQGVKPGFFEWGLSTFLGDLKNYIHYRNFSTYTIETKLTWLGKLREIVSGYITELKSVTSRFRQWQSDRLQAFEKLQGQIDVEYRHLLGVPEKSKIYLPEDEDTVKEKFAHGNSASVDRIKYKDDFDAIFKSASIGDEVISVAARRFELKGTAGELGLHNRSVLFCEIDSLLGSNLVPETWYAVHNNKPGSCQAFVDGCALAQDRTITLDQQVADDLRDELLSIWQGHLKANRYELTFRDPSPFTTDHPPTQQQLEDMLDNEEISIVQTKLAEVAPVDLRHPEVQKCLADAKLLDFLCGNVDRNMSNILYVKEIIDGQPVLVPRLIDNDLSFVPAHDAENSYLMAEGASPETAHMVLRPPRFIDRSTAAMLMSLSKESIFRLAELHHLSDVDQAALMSRHDVLLKAIERGECELIDVWGEDVFDRAIAHEGSYLERADSARKISLNSILALSPGHAADAIATMLPVEGGEFIGNLLSQLPYDTGESGKPCIKNILRAFDKKHCIRTHAEATSVVILLNSLLSRRQDITGQTEGVWMLRKFLGQNTRPEVAATVLCRAREVSELRPPGFFNYDILNEVMQNTTRDAGMNPEKYEQYRIHPHLKRVCPTLTKAMAVSDKDGETQATLKKASLVSYSVLLDAAPFDPKWKETLRFWEQLTLKTTSEFQQKYNVSLERAPELTYAHSRLTPAIVREIKTMEPGKVSDYIKQELIPRPPQAYDGKTASRVHDLLCLHFLGDQS